MTAALVYLPVWTLSFQDKSTFCLFSLGPFEGHNKINSADTKSSRRSTVNICNHPLFQQCGGREKEKGGEGQRNLHVVILIFQFCIGLLEGC